MAYDGAEIQEDPPAFPHPLHMPRWDLALLQLLLDVLGDRPNVPIRVALGNDEIAGECSEF